ncbi:MAG: hypothetical protein QX196_06650 [Methylococcaceae bacterium]
MADITRSISNASVETIERWFDLAIDAQQLSDIFKDMSIGRISLRPTISA